jgi:hypothetical protein
MCDVSERAEHRFCEKCCSCSSSSTTTTTTTSNKAAEEAGGAGGTGGWRLAQRGSEKLFFLVLLFDLAGFYLFE